MARQPSGTRKGSASWRVGIDIGGTFTDFVIVDGQGRVQFGKVLTTPEDPLRAVIDGLRRLLINLQVDGAAVEHVVHGTTLFTNAVIERKGARTALLTTRGFEDVLEIGREQRYDLYDLHMLYPEPLVPRRLRIGVAERTDHTGTVLTSLDERDVARAARIFKDHGIESLAVGFLHSWQNPENERRAGEIVRAAASDIEITISSEVLPEIREYERISTAVLNAYVQPLARRYLGRLRTSIAEAGAAADVHVMTSRGHLTTTAEAERTAVRLIESGPAGGCLAAVYHAREIGLDNLLAFDMGGTTAKACLIHEGQPFVSNQFEAARVVLGKRGSGIPVRVPAIDLIEIGSGGGSIAAKDALGLLRVGPRSAGADPGPACYGRGGAEPTVTDANLILGYLGANSFLGGDMPLDVDRGRRAIESLARELGLGTVEAALGIHRIVNESMANAARVHALEKGKDPRNYPLFAFGGAGPIHAYDVARLLGTATVIVPKGAGVTSALGFLAAPVATDCVRTYLTALDAANWQHVSQLFADMEGEAMQRLSAAGVVQRDMKMERSSDMRFVGQGFDVTVPLPSGRLDASRIGEVIRAFHEIYKERYGHAALDQKLEVVSWRVLARGPEPRIDIGAWRPRGDLGAALKGHRPAYFTAVGGFAETPIYDRDRLDPGTKLQGPALLEERESTVVVPPRACVEVNPMGSVIITLSSESETASQWTSMESERCQPLRLTR